VLPGRLYKLLYKYDLITTAIAESYRVFETAPVLNPDGVMNLWTRHNWHGLKCAMQLHPFLKRCRLTFRQASVGIRIDIDRDIAKRYDFNVHHRLLDYAYVHSQRKTCPLYQSTQTNEDEGTCHCGAEGILNILLAQVGDVHWRDSPEIGQAAMDLFKTMPWNVTVREVEREVEVQWKITAESYFGGFDVIVCKAGHDGGEHLYFQGEENGEGNDADTTDIANPNSNPGQNVQTKTTQSRSGSPILLRLTTKNTASYTLDPTTAPLQPGTKYTLLLRPAQSQAFYSPTVSFQTPIPAPTNLVCTRKDASLVVRWDSNIRTGRFRVAVVDNAEWTHISPWIEGTEYLVPEVPPREVWVGVVVEAVGLRSVEARVVVPPLSEELAMEKETSPEEMKGTGTGGIEAYTTKSDESLNGASASSGDSDHPSRSSDVPSNSSDGTNAEPDPTSVNNSSQLELHTSQTRKVFPTEEETQPWEGNPVSARSPATAKCRARRRSFDSNGPAARPWNKVGHTASITRTTRRVSCISIAFIEPGEGQASNCPKSNSCRRTGIPRACFYSASGIIVGRKWRRRHRNWIHYAIPLKRSGTLIALYSVILHIIPLVKIRPKL
jgi:hypothetical protein